jgi:hypothetical protein
VLTRQRDLEPAGHRPPVDADPVVLWRGAAASAASEKVAPARPPEPRRSSRFSKRFGLPAH